MRKTTLLLVLALVAGVAACSPEETPVETPAPTPEVTPECGELAETSFEVFATRLTVAALNIQAIAATDADVWFVAGQIGEGDAEGELALWAALEDPTDRILDTFYSVNEAADEASDWGELPEEEVTGEVSETDPSIDILFDCVSE